MSSDGSAIYPFGSNVSAGPAFGGTVDRDTGCIDCGRTYRDLPQGEFMTEGTDGPNVCVRCLTARGGRIL